MDMGQKRFSGVHVLIFDLDGTLIDSKLDLALSVNAALVQEGHPALPHEQIYSYVGQGASMLIRRSLGEGSSEQECQHTLEFFLGYYHAHMLDNTVVYPGVREGLAQLAGFHMAVLTNKPMRFSREILQGLGLAECFRFIYGGNSFERKKPDPTGVGVILRDLQAAPPEAMMVGDSEIDVQTARNAGTWACGVTYGLGSAQLAKHPPDILLDSLAELPSYLDDHRSSKKNA